MGVTGELPRWQCHKVVQGAKIVSIAPCSEGPGAVLGLEGVASPATAGVMTDEWMWKHGPVVGGYLVVYEGGYASFSPAEVFEAGYRRIA